MCECGSEYNQPYCPLVGWKCKKCGEIIIENPIKVLEMYAESVMNMNRANGKEIKSICLKLRTLIG